MNTTLTTREIENEINILLELIRQGVDAWVKAGEILVRLVESDPHTYDYILEKCPTLNTGVLARLEQIGRKIIHPQLLLSSGAGLAKLRRLPISLQERYINEPVPLVVHTDHGTDTMLVKAQDMTKEQAEQAFGPGRLRTQSEQAAWLMQKASDEAKPVKSAQVKPWTIRGGKAIINGVEFTKKDILAIAMAME